jgi:PAS domain S-box-containing protein
MTYDCRMMNPPGELKATVMLKLSRSANADLDFLVGGGEMGERMRALDWSQTPLGAAAGWPQSLKTIVRVMLDSRYAMWMLWGPELTFFCNDAYLPTVGLKRDWVLGARSDKVWEEIWPDIGPRIQRVLEAGRATWDEGLLLFLERNGFPEESYHTFSYSPIYDDGNRIAGMLCVVTEVTDRVIGERRLRVLRDLALSPRAELTQQAIKRLVDVLANNPLDVAFAALYLLDQAGQSFQLINHFGKLPEVLRPTQIPLTDARQHWQIDRVLRSGEPQLVEIERGAQPIAAPLWADEVNKALVLPIPPGTATCVAVLVIGVSPRRPFDDGYRGFFDLVAAQFAAAIADAQAYEAERQRAEALAEIDRAKITFFSNVSHEFRTPLTLLLGPIEELLASPTTPEFLHERIALVHRNALRLLKLVNSLLDFSRIEAGRAQASYELVDLGALTTDLASMFRAAMERAGLQLIIECDCPASVYVDREMWEKIVFNLLSNAFKFTFSGHIAVRLRGEESAVVLEVTDTGVGIAADEIPHIFQRFHRIEGSPGRTQEGSGIGLALVQELVKFHCGAIEVHSTLNRGTTFRVRIPLGSAHLAAARIKTTPTFPSTAIVADAFVQEALRWIPQNATATSLAGPVLQEAIGAREGFAVSGARIVLADDNADMRAYVRDLLAPVYDVEDVPDGEAALAAIHREPPDLVVSDVMMPRLDGFGLLQAVRSTPALREIPFILLSARAGEEARVEGLDARADDYLVKPFAARELLSRINTLLALSQMRRAGEARLRQFMDSVTDGFYVLDPDMRFKFVNAAIAARFGKSETEILGTQIWQMFPEAVGSEAHTQLARAMRERVRTEFEVYFAPWERWFRGSVYPIPDGGVAVYTKDITEERRANQLVERQNSELREADRQKDEFLAMLAHELRTPLASISNASELLARLVTSGPRMQLPLAVLKRQTKQLTRLVDDLLDISRIARGRITLEQKTFDIRTAVDQAIEMVHPAIQQKSHHFVVAKPHAPLFVCGDLSRLVQAISNILNNAAKYTDAGGELRLEVLDSEHEVAIAVHDNGAGISADLLPYVFNLFVQSERTLDRSQGGLGIGLSVVKRLVEMHHGSVRAHSEGVGKGSAFTIRLPRVPAPQESEALIVASAPAAPRRILIVDDNVDAADSLAMLLKLDGHEVHTVYGAEEALEACSHLQPQVIFLDIGLPQMDGYEVARRLRGRNGHGPLHLVALTGYGQKDDRERSHAAGFNNHLVKPVTPEALETLFRARVPDEC